MSGRWLKSVLLLLIFTFVPVSALHAASFQADYVINLFPPSPVIGVDLTGATLGGDLTLYYQFDPGDDPVAIPNPGPPGISGIVPGESYTGSLTFDLDLEPGAPTFFVSFAGELTMPNPGPPNMPVFAFDVGAEPAEAPAEAPLITVGTYFPPNPVFPDIIAPPSLLNAPLFAFASVHEIGALSLVVHPAPVPVPSAAVLVLAGLSSLGLLRRHRG